MLMNPLKGFLLKKQGQALIILRIFSVHMNWSFENVSSYYTKRRYFKLGVAYLFYFWAK